MNKPLILIVEDDAPVSNLMVTALKTNDYRYLAAPDGKTAVMEASSHNPDIVLLDLGLPDDPHLVQHACHRHQRQERGLGQDPGAGCGG